MDALAAQNAFFFDLLFPNPQHATTQYTACHDIVWGGRVNPMQDSAGMTGREKKNRIEMGEDIPAIQNTDSPSGLYTLESPGRSIPGSSIPAERPAFAVQEPLPPAPDPPEYFLPRRYDETILSLMVRDPYWVYAYWDISTTDVCRIDRDHGYGAWSAGSKILRVYDVTDGGAHLGRALMNIGIGDDSASWYINVPE